MSRSLTGGRRASVPALLAACIQAALLSALPADAVQAQSPAADAQESRRYDIPAQPLAQAVVAFGRVSGVQLVLDSEHARNVQAGAVHGEYRLDDALHRLLAGTGLVARSLQGGVVSIEQAADAEDGVMVTGALAVEGRATSTRESMFGGVDSILTEGSGSYAATGPAGRAATGLDMSLRETPQSITVFTRDRIEDQQLLSMAEVAEQMPGIHFRNTGVPIGGRTELFARGHIIDNYQVDGVTTSWNAMGESDRYGQSSLDTAIYDSVAVVRGATGLLTGAGDPSASISLTRKRPTEAFSASVEVSAGRWDHHRAVIDVGGPLNATGTLRGRAVAVHDQTGTWVERYSNDRSLFYGILEADLAKETRLSATLEHARDSSEGAPWASGYGLGAGYDNLVELPFNRTANEAPEWAYSDSVRTSLTLALDHRFNEDWTGRFSYGYSNYTGDYKRGMPQFATLGGLIPANGAPGTTRILIGDLDNDVHTFDGKLEGRYRLWGREHDVVAGFNHSRVNSHSPVSYYEERPNSVRFDPVRMGYLYDDIDWTALPLGTSNGVQEQSGAYAATNLKLADKVSLIAGARWSRWETEYVYRGVISDSRKYSGELTPYAGLTVGINAWLSAYASYTEIFKPQSAKDVNGKLLDPEEGENYELGLKSEWFDGALNASLAAFQTRKDNLAVRDGNNLTPEGEFAYRAEDNTKGEGWELEVTGEILPGWNIQMGYTRFVRRSSEGARLDTGWPVQQVKLFTAWTPARLPQLTVGGGVNWQSDTWMDLNAYLPYIPQAYHQRFIDLMTNKEYALVSVMARYAFNDRLSLALNVNNALDKTYRVSAFGGHSYGAERNLTATLKYRFD